MDLTEKIKITMIKQKCTQTKLAELTGQSQKNLSGKMKRNNFTINEFEKLVTALGCQLEIKIILPTGEKI